MSQYARENPEAYEDGGMEEYMRQAEIAASRCPHGEAHWKDCEVCVADERGVRIWERSLDK